ncbi:hypothetical protein BH11PSE2_BH11PSE2_11270 [soil metagenome]
MSKPVTIAAILVAAFALQGCVAVAVGGAAVGVAGAVVGGAAKGVGAVGHAVIGGDKDKNDKR